MEQLETRIPLEKAPDVLLKSDLSRVLPYSESYLARLLSQGKLPARKMGSRWIVLKSELQLWLQGLDRAK